jgi:large subunit ribosomal protein L10
MPKAEKIDRVAELKAGIEGSDALLLTEYRGLTVSDITELRRSLAEGGTRFAVVKNTLMQRAAADASIEDLESLLEGPTAVAFVAGDPVAAAKKVVDAAKKFPALILKGGYMEGKVLSADEAKGLADLDSKEVMLSKIAGLLKGEMSRAASMLVSAQSKFLSLLEAYKEKVPDDSVVEEAPATDEASATDEAPAAAEPEPAAEPEAAADESERAAEPEPPSEPQAADAQPEAQPDAAPEQPDEEGEE